MHRRAGLKANSSLRIVGVCGAFSRGSSLPTLYKSNRCLLRDRYSQIKSNGYESQWSRCKPLVLEWQLVIIQERSRGRAPRPAWCTLELGAGRRSPPPRSTAKRQRPQVPRCTRRSAAPPAPPGCHRRATAATRDRRVTAAAAANCEHSVNCESATPRDYWPSIL